MQARTLWSLSVKSKTATSTAGVSCVWNRCKSDFLHKSIVPTTTFKKVYLAYPFLSWRRPAPDILIHKRHSCQMRSFNRLNCILKCLKGDWKRFAFQAGVN
ncbi:hypothetical protein EB796_011296 [Bugula neritina]|uniref:Uncharacterized protein n=1 Tax=Bugula neritina TaxID=10212 RepID=A0A7J7JWR8_BUGNE|nr:hypothetical protein EB796_011296 [Bugula neritina]